MNLPLSDVIEQGKKTAEFDYKSRLNSCLGGDFSGYIVLTIDGFDGMEEGVLIFRKGYLSAGLYEFLNYGITMFGDSSLKHTFNAFLNDKGIVDVYGLTNQQVDLVTAFNDKIKLTRPVTKGDASKLFALKYSSELSKELLKEVLQKQESKDEVLKKFGLTSLG